MMHFFNKALDTYAIKNQLRVSTSFETTTLTSIIVAEKNGWGFELRLVDLDFMEDDWVRKLSRLFHGLVQYAKGMWFTSDDEDQFEMNFDLFKYKEEEKYETVYSGYPQIKECTRSTGF